MKSGARPGVLAAVLLLLSAMVMAGCNTTRGIGRDVKSVGTAIEKAVD